MCACNKKNLGVSIEIDNVGHVPSNAWAMQREELEARAQHVETSGVVPYESCPRVGCCGRSQAPANSAARRGVQVATAIRRGVRAGARGQNQIFSGNGKQFTKVSRAVGKAEKSFILTIPGI